MYSILENLQNIFTWILHSTLQASLLISLIHVLKLIFRDKMRPQWQNALWLLVLIRLSLPWAPESALSVYNYFFPVKIEANLSSFVYQTEDNATDISNEFTQPAETKIIENKPRYSIAGIRNRSGWPFSWVVLCIWLSGVLLMTGYTCPGRSSE